MAQYFVFFAQGQEVCTPSFVEYSAVGTVIEDTRSGALPVYDRTSGRRKLLGVAGMDFGQIMNPWNMTEESGWDMAVCKMSDMSKMCRPLELQECDRQKIRLQYDESSVCPDSEGVVPSADEVQSAVCLCPDPECTDNR